MNNNSFIEYRNIMYMLRVPKIPTPQNPDTPKSRRPKIPIIQNPRQPICYIGGKRILEILRWNMAQKRSGKTDVE